jgi:hypothetical protein
VEGQLGTEEALIDETEDAGGWRGAGWVAWCVSWWVGGVAGQRGSAEGAVPAGSAALTPSKPVSRLQAWHDMALRLFKPLTTPPYTHAGFAKVEKRVRTAGGGSTGSVRNLRIREDTAKYLLNLDTNSGRCWAALGWTGLGWA